MAIEINGKVYRNIQEQVEKNTNDIEDLNHRVPYEPVFYTADEVDTLFYNKEEINENYYDKDSADEQFAAKDDVYTKTEADERYLPIIHLYKIDILINDVNGRTLAEFIFASSINRDSGYLTNEQFRSTFDDIYLKGSGGIINTSNQVISINPTLDTSASRLTFNQYDSEESDWVDLDIDYTHLTLTKLF